jgi:enoyl-CoA hydratase
MTDDQNDIIVEKRGGVGILTLNRPKALNALSYHMIRSVSDNITAWADDPSVRAIVIRGAGDRAFCAGGDIKAVYQAGTASPPVIELARRYFAEEYRLNHALYYYAKPVVALMNGIVMGGGYGLAGQCRFRVACENTQFAMPEVGIGFFPDVGSAWHLARMKGLVGIWLGLTGLTVGQADAGYTGVATHHCKAVDMDAMPDRLAKALEDAPHSDAQDVIASFLNRITIPAQGVSELDENKALIAQVFAADSVETIIDNLKRTGSDKALSWASTIESHR